ncbi:MAG: T9SS type A sorting domain-containing protein [Bacteroidota bacterium]
MRRNHTKIYSRILLLAVTMLMSFTMIATPKQKTDTTYLHLSKLNKKDKNILKSFHITLPAVKTYLITPQKPTTVAQPDDKLLSNVQVYPNPVSDQINVKYAISRASNVNIKIMDVLGNEVVTLVSQHLEPGELKTTYSLKGKLNSGFYFVRVVVGTESVIRRISIL